MYEQTVAYDRAQNLPRTIQREKQPRVILVITPLPSYHHETYVAEHQKYPCRRSMIPSPIRVLLADRSLLLLLPIPIHSSEITSEPRVFPFSPSLPSSVAIFFPFPIPTRGRWGGGGTYLSYPFSNAFPAKPPSTSPAIVAPILPFPFLCAVSCAMTAPATAPIMPAPTPRSEVEKCSLALSSRFEDFERDESLLPPFFEERWAGRSSSDEEPELL